jgi:regulator of protease activity HflC (stomatin/prohibitin superfamily)
VTIGELVKQVLDWIYAFWPMRTIHDWEQGVRDTNIEVVETDLQTHTSADGLPVTFSMGLKYRIANLKRMYQSIHDARETLYNEICSLAGWCAGQMEYEAIRHDLCEQVIHETKEQMGEWGIEVLSLHLINMSEAKPLRLIMNRGASSVAQALD